MGRLHSKEIIPTGRDCPRFTCTSEVDCRKQALTLKFRLLSINFKSKRLLLALEGLFLADCICLLSYGTEQVCSGGGILAKPTLKQILDALKNQVLVGKSYLDLAKGLLKADPVILQSAQRSLV